MVADVTEVEVVTPEVEVAAVSSYNCLCSCGLFVLTLHVGYGGGQHYSGGGQSYGGGGRSGGYDQQQGGGGGGQGGW